MDARNTAAPPPPPLPPHTVMPGPARTISGYPGISIRRAPMDGRNKCGHDVMVVASLAACSDCSYIWAETEPRPPMDHIGASKARRRLPLLLDHAAQRESVTITRPGRPDARIVPVIGNTKRPQAIATQILDHCRGVPSMTARILSSPPVSTGRSQRSARFSAKRQGRQSKHYPLKPICPFDL